LDPLRAQPDARDRGIIVHSVLEQFVKQRPAQETRAQARARLLNIARTVLLNEVPFPATRAIWFAKLNRGVDNFLTQEGKYQSETLAVETVGRQQLDGLPFALFGTPDRIDRLNDGRLHLIDYKTGKPPSEAQQDHYSKQLRFAAAMAERGGFTDLGPSEVAMISYIGLGAETKPVVTQITPELMDQEWAKLIKLITRYFQRATGYTARRALFETKYDRTYDHLSRFGEWQMTDRAHPAQWVGPKENP
jgi:RecB family exonuclease